MMLALLFAAAFASPDSSAYFSNTLIAYKSAGGGSSKLLASLQQWAHHESDPAVYQLISKEMQTLAAPSTPSTPAADATSVTDNALEAALEDDKREVAPRAAAAPATHPRINNMWNWKPPSSAADSAAVQQALGGLGGLGGLGDSAPAPAEEASAPPRRVSSR